MVGAFHIPAALTAVSGRTCLPAARKGLRSGPHRGGRWTVSLQREKGPIVSKLPHASPPPAIEMLIAACAIPNLPHYLRTLMHYTDWGAPSPLNLPTRKCSFTTPALYPVTA
ncbi:hypothetical protein GDO81_001718 [Engystomops pustulosus]|uniref:Uncharacterized protein n=1 Tax=Engystomops pustulosus TaxID=76066 RepID=A0AAV7DIR6_ENGPU|nr:hypothetical protein GDO81_001718 [Engystomops pustulosus]